MKVEWHRLLFVFLIQIYKTFFNPQNLFDIILTNWSYILVNWPHDSLVCSNFLLFSGQAFYFSKSILFRIKP